MGGGAVRNQTTRLRLLIFFFSISLSIIIISFRILHHHAIGRKDVKVQIYPQPWVELSPLNCTAFSREEECPTGSSRIEKKEEEGDGEKSNTCPEYFRWIHEDLKAWARTGITRETVERGRAKAHFRLVIVDGRAYVEKYAKAFESRDSFTLWGILQLLRLYPGKIPDLDLMFNCGDRPNVFIGNYSNGPESGPNLTGPPPPVFRYCGDDDTLDIVFPDWSFWGWPEINIKPWEKLVKDLKEGNKRRKWINRERYAYWKGSQVSWSRYKLIQCNVSHQHHWNVLVYKQDWNQEGKKGFKDSNLADQCVHRYKMYVEGIGWSVSLKYILACDSVTLMIKPHYYDFFSRSLVPMDHYWPIRVKQKDMCKSIKFAVDWGNTHKQKAQSIGKAATKFTQQQLRMENVYDYMFHSLNEYSKLLTFKPTIPPNATELCLEELACPPQGLSTNFMLDTLVKHPSLSTPCSLSPPFTPADLDYIRTTKETRIKQVEMWEENVPSF